MIDLKAEQLGQQIKWAKDPSEKSLRIRMGLKRDLPIQDSEGNNIVLLPEHDRWFRVPRKLTEEDGIVGGDIDEGSDIIVLFNFVITHRKQQPVYLVRTPEDIAIGYNPLNPDADRFHQYCTETAFDGKDMGLLGLNEQLGYLESFRQVVLRNIVTRQNGDMKNRLQEIFLKFT